MKDYEVGKAYYFYYNEILKQKKDIEFGIDKDTIVYSKYGPQLKLLVTDVKFKGLFGKVLDINYNRIGHYTEWEEYKTWVENNPNGDLQELLDMLNS